MFRQRLNFLLKGADLFLAFSIVAKIFIGKSFCAISCKILTTYFQELAKDYTERQKYVSTPYFHEVKIQFLRQYYSKLKSHFNNTFYTINPLH